MRDKKPTQSETSASAGSNLQGEDALALDFRVSPLRLLGECLLITVLIEVLAMAVLPVLAPHSSSALIGALDICLLIFFAAPLMYWRVRTWCNRNSTGARSHLHASRISIVLAISVLLIGGLASHITSWEMRQGIKASAHARFNELAGQVISETERRLKTFEYGLRGARGIFVASHRIDRSEFRDYVCSRDVPREFPGVLGFGYIQRVQRASLDEYIQSQRQSGATDFNVRTSGTDPELDIVQYVEPLATNRPALGFDTRCEAVRRAALERSFETGTATLTSKITLMQDKLGRGGFLYLLPVYRHGTNPLTPQERREAAVGWVYAAIVIENALDGVTDAAPAQLDLDVFDGETRSPAALLYDTSPDDYDRPGTMFSEVHAIELGGRTWSFQISTLPKFEASIDYGTPILTTMGGMTVSTLLAAIVLFLGNGRTRAIAIAQDMTRGFRESERRAQDARTRAESAAAALSAFKDAVDDSAIVSITDTQGRIIDVNDQFCAVSGYARDELIGRNHRMVSSRTHTPEFWAKLWRSIQTTGYWRGEVCNRAKDG